MAATVYEAGEIGRRAALDAGVRDVDPEARQRPGRPSKFTPEVAATICQATAVGLTREEAAGLAGVDPATMYRWMADRRPRFRAFQRSLMQAEGAAGVLVAANLVARTRVSTRAGIFWLTTRHPEDWPPPERGRRKRVRPK